MGSPDGVVGGGVGGAESVAPDYVVGGVDDAVVVEVAGERDAEDAVGVELRGIPFELAGEGGEADGGEGAGA